MCAEEMIWQQHTDTKKRLQVQARGMMETAAKKVKIVKPGDDVIVPVPDLDRAKIDARSLHAVTFKIHFNSCLEQNIKNISQFIHVKHTFLCREGMLLGSFARNQTTF